MELQVDVNEPGKGKADVCVSFNFTFCLLMVLRENMDESPESAMETPGRSIFSSTLSLCFLRSFSSFLFFLMVQDRLTGLLTAHQMSAGTVHHLNFIRQFKKKKKKHNNVITTVNTSQSHLD